MKQVFADFHVHVGRSLGKPVKMAAAPSLTLENLLDHARSQKGLDLVTVIDGVCSGVRSEIRQLLADSRLIPVDGGGFEYENGLRVLLGAEVEVAGPNGGAAHFGAWFGTYETAEDFGEWLGSVQKNVSLSSQRIRSDAFSLQKAVKSREGLFVVHHAFTPHKGLYGNCITHMQDMVDPQFVDALELGLSADTDMADGVSELAPFTFLSNSDAHSLPKIAREYNALKLESVNFSEVRQALLRQSERKVVANYGLLPALGKYHRTYCLGCGSHWAANVPACSLCGSTKKVMGVHERLQEVQDIPSAVHPSHRPPYIHQVPLEFIPGLGPKLRARLIDAFGNEMTVLHRTSVVELAQVVGETLAVRVEEARSGRVRVSSGGGGIYGKLQFES